MAPESESDFGFLDEVSNGELTAAPGSTSEGEGFYATTSSARWGSLCAAAADPGCRLAELPALLAPLVAELPLRFARYAYQLAVGAPPEPDNEVMGLFQSSNPTMNRPPAPSRQRDLLPLPCASLAAEDLPREVSHTQNMKTRKRARAGWLFLLIAGDAKVSSFNQSLEKETLPSGLQRLTFGLKFQPKPREGDAPERPAAPHLWPRVSTKASRR